jgi:outer membrane protein assembly factor BamB
MHVVSRRRAAAVVLLSLAAVAAAAQPPDLVAAAITGDLDAVRRLLDGGVPVDTADRWGGTALAFAASEGRVEVVRFLLGRGADPSKRETFFDQSPLGRALGGGPFTEGLPSERLEIAILLLRAGADDRELALETAIARGNVELARAAVDGGPLYASSLGELRRRAASRGAPFVELLDGARSRPDPPPPRLGPTDLARFAGRFEGTTTDDQATVHDGPYLAAWDLETGEERWRTPRPGVAPSWATPALWSTPQGVELVANASTIRGYSVSDGRELWSLEPTSEQVVATPVVAGGILYVSSGYPPVKPIYAVKPGLRGRVQATPGAPDERFLWSDERGGAYMPTPLVYRGLLYIVHHNARLVAYDAATGDAVYKARFSQGGTFTSSPVAVDGRVYTGTEEGSIYVFASGPVFEELAVNDMGEPVMATPAIANGVLYVRTPSRLVALAGR